MTIGEAQQNGSLKDHQLVTNSQDVKQVLEAINECVTCWSGLFVKTHEGEYVSVYAYKGIIPAMFKLLTKLK